MMLRGILVVNGCMRTPKFEEITKMYQQAAEKYHMQMKVVYNNSFVFGANPKCFVTHEAINEVVDFVLFLDKDIRLARQLEREGIRVFNSSHVIEVCDDKSATCMVLAEDDVPMPKTIIAPLIYPGTYKSEEDPYISRLEAQLTYPFVVKECFGSFGEQVYKVENREELVERRKQLAHIPHLYQEMVKSSYGRDVRIQVVGGEVVAAMERSSSTDFRANISSGGKMKPFQTNEAFSNLALRVCELLGADFAGVDLLFGAEGEPILCEVNSNAHIKNIYDCTGVNVAEKILDYIERELRNK